MRCLASMLARALSTQVSRAVGNGPWLVSLHILFLGSRLSLIYEIGILSDATKSVSRAYINNFQDKDKQAAIDMFLVRKPCNS